MPYVTTRDGTKLYCEETGVGQAAIFLHEFAGDWRSWESQVRALSRIKRCVTFSARGYPPSDVPTAGEAYAQDIVRDDVIAVMDHLGIERAHIVGHSMGAYTALHVGIQYPQRCLSVVAAGCGWGSTPSERAASLTLAEDIGRMFADQPIAESASRYADFPMRHAFKAKDPRGWAEFGRHLAERSPIGCSLTMLNLQLKRPTLWDMEAQLKAMTVPLLVIVGDEDWPCLDGSVFLKKTVPTAALQVIPRASHTINSEEPAIFNAALEQLFAAVEADRWMAHRAS